MGLRASNKSKSRDPIPAGTHHAVCYSVVDLGIQTSTWKNETKKQWKTIITWEIPSFRIKIERGDETLDLPRVISREYTLSTHKKSNLSKDLVGWLGRSLSGEERLSFDLGTLAGKNCLLTIIHNERDDNVYANVSSVAKLMDGLPIKQPENPLLTYEIENGFDFPENMPDWIVNKIKDSDNWAAAHGESPPNEPSDDEVASLGDQFSKDHNLPTMEEEAAQDRQAADDAGEPPF